MFPNSWFSPSHTITEEASIVPFGTLKCALIMTKRPNKWKPWETGSSNGGGRKGAALGKVCPLKKY